MYLGPRQKRVVRHWLTRDLECLFGLAFPLPFKTSHTFPFMFSYSSFTSGDTPDWPCDLQIHVISMSLVKKNLVTYINDTVSSRLYSLQIARASPTRGAL